MSDTSQSDGVLAGTWARGAVAAAVGVAVNLLLVVLADGLSLAPGFMALSFPPVAFLSAAGAVGATGFYVLLQGRVADPDRTFRRVAVALLVVSLVPDLGLLVADDAATPAGVAVLMAMHVVVAGLCIRLLPESRP